VKPAGTLWLALAVSLLVHALVLSLHFVGPERFNRSFQDTPLDVVLVNAKTRDKVEQAQLIAQTSLSGGGQRDAGRAASPLPMAERRQAGDAAEDAQQQRLAALQRQQLELLTLLQQQVAALPAPQVRPVDPLPGQLEREARRQQLSRMLAEIETRMEEENARPQKRFISPATREESYAVYYDSLRRKIEKKGTQAFPEANGQKLYGGLTLQLTISADGRLLSTHIVKGSGQPVLDRQAASIARAAAPFGSFTPPMRLRADQLVVVSHFEFSRDGGLQTRFGQR
jgi:protein TonB